MNRIGHFLFNLFINLILSARHSIPAWILLALHLWCGISVWWFIGGLIYWILRVLIAMWLVDWAADCSAEKDPPKENKNPYSVKKRK